MPMWRMSPHPTNSPWALPCRWAGGWSFCNGQTGDRTAILLRTIMTANFDIPPGQSPPCRDWTKTAASSTSERSAAASRLPSVSPILFCRQRFWRNTASASGTPPPLSPASSSRSCGDLWIRVCTAGICGGLGTYTAIKYRRSYRSLEA